MSQAVGSRTRSEAAFEEAQKVMPGGVNSPVRAFRSVGGNPVFIERANGAHVWDIDGNRYIDYVGTWGPAILGHAHPQVIRRVQTVAEKGTSFGAPTLMETELAKLVIELVPSIEKVRFVNSGTEAVMSAIRLARAFTGRSKIIKFEGCYHGHSDYLLVKAGSGAATHGIPDSAGVPASTAAETLTAEFNNLDFVRALLEANAGQVAGLLVEPVAGNMGCIPPAEGFLEGLRQLANAHGACLIFDEVMTGFRVALGGAQERYGVTPDITCLGKIIGGGLPVGAYGGKKEIMAMVAPEGPMYQAGTLSGNPLAMAAGLETLTLLKQPGVYEQLEKMSFVLGSGLMDICAHKGIPHFATQVGSMMTLFFTDGPIQNYQDVCNFDRERFNRFFWGMLDNGVYLAPSQFEAAFLSLAHTEDDIRKTLEAAEKAIS
ncbi:MAG TPA: glutamate-1-semialdehyde 2,1-aminomutase [Coleofasciculaceae cyanobacterium]|jgi:glutamate-1-semialdehyde 2,1-aminomutase